MEFKNYAKKYVKISAILSLIYCIIFFAIGFYNQDFSGIMYFLCISIIPIIISGIIYIISEYTKTKTTIINILNSIVLIIHGIFILLILLVIWIFSDSIGSTYTDVKDYKKALKSVRTLAEHFPEKIPSEAQNISLLKTPINFTGDVEFYLKFDVSEEYIIREELKFRDKGEYIKLGDITSDSNYARKAAKVLHGVTHQSVKNWGIRLLEEDGCVKEIATKDNTIVYILYCD